jgi:hypothetical protein
LYATNTVAVDNTELARAAQERDQARTELEKLQKKYQTAMSERDKLKLERSKLETPPLACKSVFVVSTDVSIFVCVGGSRRCENRIFFFVLLKAVLSNHLEDGACNGFQLPIASYLG